MTEPTNTNNIQNGIHSWEKIVQMSVDNNKSLRAKNTTKNNTRIRNRANNVQIDADRKFHSVLKAIMHSKIAERSFDITKCEPFKVTNIVHNRLTEQYNGYPFTIEKCPGYYSEDVEIQYAPATSKILLNIPEFPVRKNIFSRYFK